MKAKNKVFTKIFIKMRSAVDKSLIFKKKSCIIGENKGSVSVCAGVSLAGRHENTVKRKE